VWLAMAGWVSRYLKIQKMQSMGKSWENNRKNTPGIHRFGMCLWCFYVL
jgi:hypothetical protein